MNATHILSRFITVSLLTLASVAGWAVPAKPGLHLYTLPDGSTIEVRIVGDEHSHYYLTTDDYVLLPDARGALRYATIGADGDILPTAVTASAPSRRTPAEISLLPTIDRAAVRRAIDRTARTVARRRAPQRILGEIVTDYPTVGSPKGLVLLVEFQDIKFRTPDVRQAFENMLREPGYSLNGATGSASDYFRDNSNGAFTPDFQVYGPVTLPETEPYYGAEGASLYDVQGWLMARDGAIALREAYPDLDLSQFDNDGDGFIDNIFIFYAGYGQNEGAPGWTIWPHSAELWDMYNIDLSFDGVRFNKYACTNELRGTSGTQLTGIGTFVHEYSHILGLMDIYPTQSSARDVSPGTWDVMDSGSYNNDGNTPPHFNAFERYSLGWLNPRKLSGAENVILEPLHTSNSAVMIETERDNEFFLLENRQQDGWDTHTGGHGMLIWHIDYDREIWDLNHINNEYNHQRVDLIEADNTIGDRTRSGDPFPGAGGARSFTATSNPAMQTWIGVDPDMPITDIAEVDGRITFRVKGGGDALSAPNALPATDVTPVSFTANWEMVAGLDTYEVDVCRGGVSVPFLSQRVVGTTSLTVNGLQPSTAYTYVVRACDGDRISPDSRTVSLTTLPPSFDMLAPEALEASDVTGTAFTARWMPMDDAAGYTLDVYAKSVVSPLNETVDFTDGVRLPEGWQTNCTSTGSLTGYVGAAAPALRMTVNGDRIATAEYADGINALRFWYRANSTDAASSITVEAMCDGTWREVYTESPLSRTEGRTVVIGGDAADAPLPADATRLRIVFHRASAGSVYVDDISVDHGGTFSAQYLPGYEARDCGAVTSLRVEGLTPMRQYYYMVHATNADGFRSLPSREVSVYTDATAVHNAVSDASVVMPVNRGIRVSASTDAVVRLYAADGRLLRQTTVGAGRPVRLPAAGGVYVVTIGDRSYRVVVD